MCIVSLATDNGVGLWSDHSSEPRPARPRFLGRRKLVLQRRTRDTNEKSTSSEFSREPTEWSSSGQSRLADAQWRRRESRQPWLRCSQSNRRSKLLCHVGGVHLRASAFDFGADQCQWIVKQADRLLRRRGFPNCAPQPNYMSPAHQVCANTLLWREHGVPRTGLSVLCGTETLERIS